MRKGLIGIVAVAVFALVPGQVQAQATLGPTLAYHDDADIGVGAMLRAPLSSFGEGVGILADFIWYFPDGFDYFEVNGNVTYDFPLTESTVVPFVMAGINISRVSFDVLGTSVSDTEMGLNLGGGIEFDAGSFRPSAGARVTLGGAEGFVIFVTLPFAIGG